MRAAKEGKVMEQISGRNSHTQKKRMHFPIPFTYELARSLADYRRGPVFALSFARSLVGGQMTKKDR